MLKSTKIAVSEIPIDTVGNREWCLAGCHLDGEDDLAAQSIFLGQRSVEFLRHPAGANGIWGESQYEKSTVVDSGEDPVIERVACFELP